MKKGMGRITSNRRFATTAVRARAMRRRAIARPVAAVAAAAAFALTLSWGGQRSALAGPDGANVLHGIANINQVGNSWFITASNGAVIQYNSFNISPAELVQFLQPGSNSAVLNMIPFSGSPTTINGTLLANGIVYIANPNGVLFGNNAFVNVGGIYAAAANIDDVQFFDIYGNGNPGNLTLDFSSTPANAVVRTLAGSQVFGAGGGVHFFAPKIENFGQITVSGNGAIQLIANNDDITLVPNVNGHFLVQFAGGNALTGAGAPGSIAGPGVHNTGKLSATGGDIILGASDVYALAIRLEGTGDANNPDIHGANVDFHGDVELASDLAVEAADSIAFSANVFGAAGTENLTLTSGTSSTVGGDIHTLTDLTVNDGDLEAGSITINGALTSTSANVTSNTSVSADSAKIDGNLTAENGDIAIVNMLEVDGDATAEGHVTAGETLVSGHLAANDGDISVTNHMAAGSAFASGAIGAGSAAVGGTTHAAGGDVDIATTGVFGGTVTASGSVLVGGTASFGDDVTAQTGVIDIGDDVTLTGDVHMSAILGSIDINGNVSAPGMHNLALTSSAAGGSTVTGTIGGGVVDLAVNHGDLEAGAIDIAGNLTASNADVETIAGGINVAGEIASNQSVTSAMFVNADSTAVAGALRAEGGDISVTNHMAAGSAFASGAISAGSAGVGGTTHAAGGDVDIATSGVFGGTVHAAGSVFVGTTASFGADVTAVAGAIDVGGATTLTGNVVMTADGAVKIGGLLTGNNHDLTVNTQGETSFSEITGVDALVTDAGGTTVFNGKVSAGSLDIGDAITFKFAGTALDPSVHTTGAQIYRDMVTLEANTYLLGSAAIGGFAIEFEDTINANGAAHDFGVVTENGGIRFAADIGSLSALGLFDVQVGQDAAANHANVLGGSIIEFGKPGNSITINAAQAALNNFAGALDHTTLASIGSHGNLVFNLTSAADSFWMGVGQKMTVLGHLTINAAGGEVFLGDLNTQGNMNVTANTINLLLRPGGGSDIGVDFIAGGSFNFNGTIAHFGAGGPPLFANPSGVAPAGQIGLIFNPSLDSFRPAAGPNAGRFQDLRAQGISVEDLSDAIAGAIPRAEAADQTVPPLELGAAERAALTELGLTVRDLDELELLDITEGRGVYVDSEYGEDDQGLPIPVKGGVVHQRLSLAEARHILRMRDELYREADLQDVFGAAWNAYMEEFAAAPLEGHALWLAEVARGDGVQGLSPENATFALTNLQKLAEFTDWLEAMGLVRKEVDVSPVTRRVFEHFAPQGMNWDEFMVVVQGARVIAP